MLRRYCHLMVEIQPKTMSILGTQYAEHAEDTVWFPTAANVDDLSAGELIVIVVALAMLARPYANAKEGQQMTSILGKLGFLASSML